MANIIVVTRDGAEHVIEATEGLSIMEIVRDAGIDELQALCGGCLSCATCHIHVDPAFLDMLEAPSDDEAELLDTSSDRNAFSRLSCQLPFGDRLKGMRFLIAQED